MKLNILGMNGPFPGPDGACSGYLLQSGDTAIQLDLGSGVLPALSRLMQPEALTALVFSHWHNDHCSDVLPLIYQLQSHAAAHPGFVLPVYGPVDEQAEVRRAVQAAACMQLHDVAPGDEMTLGSLQVQVYPARHPVPAVMYRITDGRRTLCYTGDTNTQPILRDFARSADLLLADGLFTTAAWAEGKPHLSAALCAELASAAGVGRLVITHLQPGTDLPAHLAEAAAIFPDTVHAQRGMTIEL